MSSYITDQNIFAGVRAIFFDYDDTLADFSSAAREAIKSVSKDIYDYFIDQGISLKLEEIEKTLFTISHNLDEDGIFDRNAWWERFLSQMNLKAEPKAMVEWTSLYWSVASRNEAYPDGIELIDYLKKKGYFLGLITNSDGPGANKRSRISSFPLISKFDLIIIGGEGEVKPKPDLEPFIRACEASGNDMKNCLMVGDHPIKDCLPAKKVGYKTVLVDRKHTVKNAQLYADLVISNLTDLEEFF